jgi:hypothetical protein
MTGPIPTTRLGDFVTSRQPRARDHMSLRLHGAAYNCSSISNRSSKRFSQLIMLVLWLDTRVTLALELINRQGAEEREAFVPCSSSSNSWPVAQKTSDT